MIRMSNPGGPAVVAELTCTLVLALAGCSSPPATTGGGDWGGGTSGGNTTGSTGSMGPTGGSGNTSVGSSTNKGGTAANPGSSTSKGSGTGTGTAGANPTQSGTGTGTGGGTPNTGSGNSGMAMTSPAPSTTSTSTSPAPDPNAIPTAQGFTTGPTGATDLAVPPSGRGIQFATPAGAYTVMPGQEIFPNYCVVVQSEFQTGGFQSYMTVGSSHHFILYNGGQVAAGTADGTCSGSGHNWMYATSTAGQIVTENFPPNVGLDLPANTQLVINMHFINPMSTPGSPQVKINLLQAQNVMYQAGTMTSFNVQINIPAATSAGPGTQTVSGTCTPPMGANFFSMSTHTHKHATAAWVEYVHNGQTTEVVHTGATSTYPADQEMGSGTDWEHPGVGLWVAPNYLTIQAGDTFNYNCSYENMDPNTAVTVGETAANNEMCMAIGYYYPAGQAYCQ